MLASSAQGGARASCAAGAPSTVGIKQANAAPGTVVDLLVACSTPAKFILTGLSGAPEAVNMYSEASFRKMKHVSARFRIAPGVVPIVVHWRLAGPSDVAVTLPAKLAPGRYAFVARNRYTDLAWAFLNVN